MTRRTDLDDAVAAPVADGVDSSAMPGTDPKPAAAPTPPRRGVSRRGLLGGALTAALAAAVLPVRDAPIAQRPNRWRGKTRWIGHA